MERGKGERKTIEKGQDSGQGGSNTSLVGWGWQWVSPPCATFHSTCSMESSAGAEPEGLRK